jgi:predicted metal-dependent phosphoesterase TrpH
METKEVKGIIHGHSTYSYDAKLSLRALKELCQKNGISFVCMTEHTDELTKERAEEFVRECESLSDSSFLFIPGFEVPYRIEGSHDHSHVLMIGTRRYHEQYAPTIEVLKHWTNDASFVILAHPVRNQFLVDDGLLHEIDALEVWNQQYEGKRVPRTRSLKLFETLRTIKPELRATGGVDFHRKEHMGAPLISLSLDLLTEASIIEKLKEGAYTFSSDQALVYGTLPNTEELIKKHRFESLVSVSIIVLGKFVNKILAIFGLKLPKSLKEAIRKKL